MSAQICDFTGDFEWMQGSAMQIPLEYVDTNESIIPLTGYTARMQVREYVQAPDVLLELTTENGGLVIAASQGTVTINITEAVAETFTWPRGVYDIELIPPSGEAFRFMQGEIETSPEVTRA